MKTPQKEEREPMIKIKGGYSDRSGEIMFGAVLQTDDFDERTRTILSNFLFETLKYNFEEDEKHSYYDQLIEERFCKVIRSDVFSKSTRLNRGYAYYWEEEYKDINEVISCAPYNEVLDIIEYILDWLCRNSKWFLQDSYTVFNQLFEKEAVGYRFADHKLVPITDECEIAEIESACSGPYEGCRTHIQNAVSKIADRENKDYKNSIKESICAIESICGIITNDEKATLGQGIKKLKDAGVYIHPALETAFSNLYGYATDEGGIRHSQGMFANEVSFEEAKFMLVICSAFLNYLIAEYEKTDTSNRGVL